jgi:protein TonB
VARANAEREAAAAKARSEREAEASRTYFEFQVERQALPLAGNPAPVYPPMLRSANVEGEVLAQFVVDTTGAVDMTTFRILKSTHDLFTSAVKALLPNLRFSPAEVGGRRVRQLVQMPFQFNR